MVDPKAESFYRNIYCCTGRRVPIAFFWRHSKLLNYSYIMCFMLRTGYESDDVDQMNIGEQSSLVVCTFSINLTPLLANIQGQLIVTGRNIQSLQTLYIVFCCLLFRLVSCRRGWRRFAFLAYVCWVWVGADFDLGGCMPSKWFSKFAVARTASQLTA